MREQTQIRYVRFVSLCAGLCAVALVLAMLLHAPLAFAVAVWIAWPVVFAVLIAQMVSTHRPAKPAQPRIVQHEDGSIEVLR